MCKENLYVKMEKLEAQITYVGVQDRALCGTDGTVPYYYYGR